MILKDNGMIAQTTGQHGHRRTQGNRRASRHLFLRVDNEMGNDGTEDGTACADVQAIQLPLSTCFLCGWDTMSLTILGRCHIDK